MGKVYVGQTDLTIKLETGKNLAGITDVKITFRNPAGVLGSFPCVVVDSAKGIIQYAVTSINDLSVAGKWTFWAKITDTQGLVSIGEPYFYYVTKEGY
jgi:hypothetical protein